MPGLSGFHMVGQQVIPAGAYFPDTLSGRYVFKTICKQESRKFTTRYVPRISGKAARLTMGHLEQLRHSEITKRFATIIRFGAFLAQAVFGLDKMFATIIVAACRPKS